MTQDDMIRDMVQKTKEMMNILDTDMTGGTVDIMIDTIGIIMDTKNVVIMTAGIMTTVIIMMTIMSSIIHAQIKVMIETLILITTNATIIIILFTTT